MRRSSLNERHGDLCLDLCKVGRRLGKKVFACRVLRWIQGQCSCLNLPSMAKLAVGQRLLGQTPPVCMPSLAEYSLGPCIRSHTKNEKSQHGCVKMDDPVPEFRPVTLIGTPTSGCLWVTDFSHWDP